MEGVPKGINVAEIKAGIVSIPLVKDVHDLHVWTVTSGVPSLSAHVKVIEGADPATVLEAITRFLREKYRIEHVTLQLEPPAFSHKQMHI